jgi:hypothetical protein
MKQKFNTTGIKKQDVSKTQQAFPRHMNNFLSALIRERVKEITGFPPGSLESFVDRTFQL